MKNDGKIQDALNGLLEMFQTGEMPEAIARTTIRAKEGFERPSDSWSLGNRILMYYANTEDARGFKQWQKVGRYVKKGAKAFYILGPKARKITEKVKDKDGKEQEEEKVIITGFVPIPVFRYEDTDGEPLPEYTPAPQELPPLFGVAEKFGVDVKYLPRGKRPELGHFNPVKGEIVTRSYDPDVFYHELAHAVHATFRELKGGQHEDQEIVAETVSAVLCHMYGYDGYIWHGWDYIQHYANETDTKKVLQKVMRVLGDVEEILNRIFAAAEEVAA